MKHSVWRPSGKKSQSPPTVAVDTALPVNTSGDAPPSLDESLSERSVQAASPTGVASSSPPPEEDLDGLTEEEHLLLHRLRLLLPPVDQDHPLTTENAAQSSSSSTDAGRTEDVLLSLVIVANVTYRENCLRRALRHWHTRRIQHEALRHRRAYFADQYYHRTLLYVFFRAWQWRFHARQERFTLAHRASQQRSQFLQAQVWHHWRASVRQHHHQRAQAALLESRSECATARRAWQAWTCATRLRSLATALARVQQDLHCEARFDTWRLWMYTRRREAVMLAAALPLLCARPTVLLLAPVPLTQRGGVSDAWAAETRWRHAHVLSYAWLQWLKWTRRQRAARLQTYAHKVTALRDVVTRSRLNAAWRSWLLYTALARMSLVATHSAITPCWRRWLAAGHDRLAATQKAVEARTVRPLRLCLAQWSRRREARQQVRQQHKRADDWYMLVVLLRRTWRVWRRRQETVVLSRLMVDGRRLLLRHIALSRLVDHGASPQSAPPSVPPDDGASAAVTRLAVQSPRKTLSADGLRGEEATREATSRPPLSSQPVLTDPIPLRRTYRVPTTAPTKPEPLAPPPPAPHSANPTVSPRPSAEALHPYPHPPIGGPLPHLTTYVGPSPPTWPTAQGTAAVTAPPQPPVQWLFNGTGWIPLPPAAVPTTSADCSVATTFMAPPPPPPATLDMWPALFYPPPAPPSTVPSVLPPHGDRQSAPAGVDRPRAVAEEAAPDGPSRPARRPPRRHHNRRSARHRAHLATFASTTSSSWSSSTVASTSSSDTSATLHSTAKAAPAPARRQRPRRRETHPSGTQSLVPSIPNIPTRLGSGATALVHAQSSPEALYQEGKQLLLAYNTHKALADGEEAELAAVEAELRLYEHVQSENVSLGTDNDATAVGEFGQPMGDRIRHLQERFVQLHQRRLQRAQMRARLLQFVARLRSDGVTNRSLDALLDTSLARSE